jgi:HK97 family phage major capsid protein/HK97 family phage prohead protease
MLPTSSFLLNAAPPRSMKDFAGARFQRAMTIDKVIEESRSIELAFSSEVEAERWGEIEILSHAPGAVDLLRMNDGACLLFNHDMDDVIGVVESARIDPDKKGRATVRFGKSARAEEVWQDVKDGILRSVSVGYRIDEMILTERRADNVPVYTATRWQPYEISIVTVPVDTSVGVQRSLTILNSQPETNMNRSIILAALEKRGIKTSPDATDEQLLEAYGGNIDLKSQGDAFVSAARAAVPTADEERSRVRSILAIGAKYKMPDLANAALESGQSLGEFRGVALDEFDKRSRSMSESHNGIGLGEKEAKSFSFTKLIASLSEPQNRSLRDGAKFEHEVCDAAANKATRNIRGVLIPADVLGRNAYGQRDIIGVKTGAGYTGDVGATIARSLLTQSFIEMLRNKASIMKHSNLLTGLIGIADIPKQVGNASASWIGEDDQAPETDVNFGMVSLTPHTVAGHSKITRRSLMQSSMDMEGFVRAELVMAIAEAIDRASIYGDGTANTPIGILNSAPNVINFVGANPTFAELVQMETLCEELNIDAASSLYMGRAGFRGFAKTSLKFPTAASGGTIWEPGNQVNGYGTEITNQFLTGDILFGDFSQFIIGMWGGLDITVDPYTDSKRGRINIVAMQDVDFEVRRKEAFTYGNGA